MDSTYSRLGRPLTPPNEQIKETLSRRSIDNSAPLAPGAGAGITSFPSNDDSANIKPSSNNGNPFVSKQDPINSGLDSRLDSGFNSSLSPLLGSKNTDIGSIGTNGIQDNSIFSDGVNKASDSLFERDTPTPTTRNFRSSQRNETTYRIEREVLDILQWKDPVRSGAIFGITVGSILLTRWYSLLQIGAAGLTLATAVNLLYVNFVVQSKRVLTNTEASHPYQDIIDNDRSSFIDRNSVKHYSTVTIEVLETLIRALTRIVFVEDTLTSIKWLSIFFIVWKVSAHVSTMNIILAFVISAFIFPHLYITNKDVVDAHLQRGQNIIQTNLNRAHQAARDGIQNGYVKARASIAQVGTTGTDAKNTLNNASVTLKNE